MCPRTTECDCEIVYWWPLKAGCKIKYAPAPGYKCKCTNRWNVCCDGVDDNSECANSEEKGCNGCKDKDCCSTKGDCSGYRE